MGGACRRASTIPIVALGRSDGCVGGAARARVRRSVRARRRGGPRARRAAPTTSRPSRCRGRRAGEWLTRCAAPPRWCARSTAPDAGARARPAAARAARRPRVPAAVLGRRVRGGGVARRSRRRLTGRVVAPARSTCCSTCCRSPPTASRNLQRAAAEVVLGNRLAIVVGGPGHRQDVLGGAAAGGAARAERAQPARPCASRSPRPRARPRPACRSPSPLRSAQPDVVQHVSEPVRRALGAVVPTTIHRLLGPLGGQRQRFRHNAATPLPHDVVVVDETSMVSLPLLARLAEAVRPDAPPGAHRRPRPARERRARRGARRPRGGRCASTGPLAGRTVRLLRGHRFGGGTPIALLADAVRRGDPAAASAHLRGGDVVDGSSVHFVDTVDPVAPAVLASVEPVMAPLLASVRAAAEAGDAAAALDAAAVARMLCAHRHGPFGVDTWNELGERWMHDGSLTGSAWFPGRPLLATRNDPRLGLANGDTGVVVRVARPAAGGVRHRARAAGVRSRATRRGAHRVRHHRAQEPGLGVPDGGVGAAAGNVAAGGARTRVHRRHPGEAPRCTWWAARRRSWHRWPRRRNE